MILLVVKKSSKSQVQEDFHCNEDALFNVFFQTLLRGLFTWCYEFEGNLCYYYEPLVALADLKVSNSFILLWQSKNK